MPDTETDVDPDELDDSTTEAAVAAAYAELILSSDPAGNAPDVTAPVTGWFGAVDAAIGIALRMYLIRALVRFVRGSGRAEADWLPVIEQRATEVTTRVLTETAEHLADHLERSEQIRSALPTDSTSEEAPRAVTLAPPSASQPGTVPEPGSSPEPASEAVSDPVVRPTEYERAEEIVRRARVGSQLLARESVTTAREVARYELALDMGATRKRWRTRIDDRVRSTHGGLEGESIPVTSAFVTYNGHYLLHPGDPSAPLSETAGCRCRLSYLFAEGDRREVSP